MGWISGLMVAMVLGGSGTPSYSTPSYSPTAGTQSCEKKRVDACGCHHVYGVRHCHPNRRSNHCEQLAEATVKLQDFVAYYEAQREKAAAPVADSL
jgi:hypothetical protein